MNKIFLNYKIQFVTIVLIISYAVIHITLTGLYVDANLDDMFNLSARLPFGQRLLVPAMAHGLSYVLHLKVEDLFLIIEFLFDFLLYVSLIKLLSFEFNPKEAQLLTWLFFLLLPLVTVINYRYTTGGSATFFYPYDSASVFFMTLGFLLCLKEQWLYLIGLIFISTFNRESSLLLLLIMPALHWHKLNNILKPMIWGMIAYVLARIIILMLVKDLPGNVLEWYFRASKHTYFEVNLFWLLESQHLFLFIFCLAGLPILWFAFFDYIPEQYRPLRYVIWFYFLCLLMVGNFMESRIFVELLVLFYLPVCVSCKNWLVNQEIIEYPQNWLYFINRYFILVNLLILVCLRKPLNYLVIWLSGVA